MSFINLSVFLSAIIGVIIIAWIRSFDIYEKETFIAMLWAFFAGGTTSVFLALAIYKFLQLFGIDDNVLATLFGSFFIIGPVEEFAKLAGLVVVYLLIKNQFNEITDGIIYMSCVALGFSIIENYFYANAGENSQWLLVYRAFISTPAHISFSVIVGYAWYRFMKEKKSSGILLIAWLAASALHGLFDALAFSSFWNFLLLFYLYLVLRQSLKIVQYSNILSPFRPEFSELFLTPGEEMANAIVCPYCGSSEPKPLFSNRYFTACRCNSCGFYLSSVKDIEKIFRIFAPEYRSFRQKIIPVRLNDERNLNSVYGVAFFDYSGKTAFFRLSDVAGKLQQLNETIISRFRKTGILSLDFLRKIFD